MDERFDRALYRNSGFTAEWGGAAVCGGHDSFFNVNGDQVARHRDDFKNTIFFLFGKRVDLGL